MASVLPSNRIYDIIRRMEDNIGQSEAVKTCFGILAIMSREESNKQIIAKDGMECILSAMGTHTDKCDVQESGCDLLWSLAFNNIPVKEIIAKYNGASVLVRGLKRHSRSPDFLKSACGALSNLCQCRPNQDGVAAQGGLQPLVGAINAHQTNSKLMPFIFDAIASLIVGNEDNARSVSTLGFIPLVITSLSKHKSTMEVVKSGCHALAILSDVKGQASKIAFAGGVPVILSLLDTHSTFPDLHRVAAVVMLRMLQESNHVAREITCHEGVRILLKSLERGGAQQDTVAAVTHILFTVTNPASPASTAIESQLWIQNRVGMTIQETSESSKSGKPVTMELSINNSSANGNSANNNTIGNGNNNSNNNNGSNNSSNNPINNSNNNGSNRNNGATVRTQTALGGLVHVLGLYADRRDVVRAACRLLNNLGGFPGVIQALEKLYILDKILECVNIHRETRDVLESTASLLKAINRRSVPMIQGTKGSTIHGLLYVFRTKSQDEETVIACADLIAKHIDAMSHGERRPEGEDHKLPTGKCWEHEALAICNGILNRIAILPTPAIPGTIVPDDDNASVTSHCSNNMKDGNRDGSTTPALSIVLKRPPWSKFTGRMVQSLLTAIESIVNTNKMNLDPLLEECYQYLKQLLETVPPKTPDISRKIDKVMGLVMVHARGIDTSATRIKRAASVDSHADVGVTSGGGVGNGVSAANGSGSNNNSGNGSGNKGNTNTSKRSDGSNNNNAITTTINSKGPSHPLKSFLKFDAQHPSPRLLDSWPSYLERLISSNPVMVRNIGDPMNSQTGESAPDRMHLVYECASAAGRGVMSRCPTPVPYQVPPEGLGDRFEHSLSFDSEFESGNLLQAIQRADAVYDLFLRADLHTSGHTQWFYFAVSHTHPPALVRLAEQGVQVPPVRVRFNIMNLTKPDSLFNLGMRPVVYSCIDASTKGIGWVRTGSDICYYANSFTRGNQAAGEGINCYFTLSFTIEFHNPKDTVLIAYSYPFTLSDHRHYMQQLLSKPMSSEIVRHFRLCVTLGGEDCDLLVITNYRDKDRIGPLTAVEEMTTGSKRSKDRSSPKNLKPALFLSGRVHPGEPPASWMMKGILDFLTSSSPQAQLLRNSFVIFVVPILNPDGVIYGNNRCSLAGVDLNRQWKLPLKSSHPTVFALKTLMMAQKKIRDVYMYIDLHGHSRKYNVFMYGCEDKKKPKPQVKDFPRFLAEHAIGRKYVSFADCSFHIKKGRESTARVVVAREMGIPYSYTLEATFCGANYGPLKLCHMNIGHLQEVGASLCDAILNFAISEGYVKDLTVTSGLAPVDVLMPMLTTARSTTGGNGSGSGSNSGAISGVPTGDVMDVLIAGSSNTGKSDMVSTPQAGDRDLESDSEDSDDDNGGGVGSSGAGQSFPRNNRSNSFDGRVKATSSGSNSSRGVANSSNNSNNNNNNNSISNGNNSYGNHNGGYGGGAQTSRTSSQPTVPAITSINSNHKGNHHSGHMYNTDSVINGSGSHQSKQQQGTASFGYRTLTAAGVNLHRMHSSESNDDMALVTANSNSSGHLNVLTSQSIKTSAFSADRFGSDSLYSMVHSQEQLKKGGNNNFGNGSGTNGGGSGVLSKTLPSTRTIRMSGEIDDGSALMPQIHESSMNSSSLDRKIVNGSSSNSNGSNMNCNVSNNGNILATNSNNFINNSANGISMSGNNSSNINSINANNSNMTDTRTLSPLLAKTARMSLGHDSYTAKSSNGSLNNVDNTLPKVVQAQKFC